MNLENTDSEYFAAGYELLLESMHQRNPEVHKKEFCLGETVCYAGDDGVIVGTVIGFEYMFERWFYTILSGRKEIEVIESNLIKY